MKKNFVSVLIILILVSIVSGVYAFNGEKTECLNKGTEIKNKLFSFFIPSELDGTYRVVKKRNGIFIYDKISEKAGFGGFAFGIMPYKNPADHANMPGGVKIGELISKRGVLYDMVLIRPTDVQYDYVKGDSESYKRLYDLSGKVDIKGIRNNKYVKNQGMKGEDLYKDILEKHARAIKEKWDSAKLEKENMSYMYNITDKVGYAYYDTNADGIEELLIGEIADGVWKGVIYDIYTMVDRVPKHVASGGARNRYYVCDNSFICNEYSGGAMESGINVYILVENSTELFPQVSFKYDGYTNPKNPWFLSYGSGKEDDDRWENVSEERFNERKKVFEGYERFDFVPLSK